MTHGIFFNNSQTFQKCRRKYIEFFRNFFSEDLIQYFGTKSGKRVEIDGSFHDFNDYELEWTESEINWKINGKTVRTFNTAKEFENKYNPFSRPFKIEMFLGIGGVAGDYEYFPNQTLYEQDVENWNCSLFILDYIRVYQNTTDSKNHRFIPDTNVTSSDVCLNVMPLIRPKLYWKLNFSDEFNDRKTINEKLWSADHEIGYCYGKISEYYYLFTIIKINL